MTQPRKTGRAFVALPRPIHEALRREAQRRNQTITRLASDAISREIGHREATHAN
jgi:hypothetical protein